MDLKQSFGFDEEMAGEGVWTAFGTDAELLIGSLDTDRYQRALMAAQKPYRHALQTSMLTPAEGRKIVAMATARGLLLGWRGQVEDGDTVLAYAPATAVQMCLKYQGLVDFIRNYASDLTNFQRVEEDADRKNLPPFSDGL